jgi:hypothetical protein
MYSLRVNLTGMNSYNVPYMIPYLVDAEYSPHRCCLINVTHVGNTGLWCVLQHAEGQLDRSDWPPCSIIG